jgi:tetratricopeptide (TPR) repeat protein
MPAYAQRPNEGEDESSALVKEGREALKRGDLDDAGKALDQAITMNPRRVEAYVVRSAVYLRKKEYTKAIDALQHAQTLAPNDLDVLDQLGSDLVLAGRVDEGVPLLRQVVAREPARYDAQLLLGHQAHEAGHWPESVTALEAYFQHRPSSLANEDGLHYVELADSYLRSRDPAKALELFERAAESRKDDLRVRIGIAWTTAALDCRKARPLLAQLAPVAEQHPEVWLVDGQCALALGDVGAALGLGRKYLDRVPAASAAGHALVGEAQAARGNLGEARHELETAHELEPTRRRWVVRLAYVLRKNGSPDDALTVLDQLGPPATPGLDPDWWLQLGETLLAKNDPTTAATRLAPVAGELPGDAPLHVVLGAAQLGANQLDAAIKTLEEADAITSTPRGKRLLATALTASAAQKLGTGDAAGAEPQLAKADQLDGNPTIWRDLGLARLALGRPDAAALLDRAAKADGSATTQMLAARARAQAGDVVGARPLYEHALAAAKDNEVVEIALDWAATELAAGGDPAIAVTALEKTQAAAKGTAQAQHHKMALADARHAAGLAALRSGNGARAVELLKAVVAADPSLASKCDLALAQVVANDHDAAFAALHAVTGQSCPFPPPADLQAAPILTAFTEGLNPRRAGKALDRLTSLGGKSTGAAAALLGTSIRVVALNAAQDAYRGGDLGAVRRFLATAKNANARVGSDEVAHNLAVIELADGHLDAAIQQLERVAAKVPEALVNLGIAYERKGDPQKALDAWKRARKAGVRYAPLNDWIESKERIYGEGSQP